MKYDNDYDFDNEVRKLFSFPFTFEFNDIN